MKGNREPEHNSIFLFSMKEYFLLSFVLSILIFSFILPLEDCISEHFLYLIDQWKVCFLFKKW